MPRLSKRARLIKELKYVFRCRLEARQYWLEFEDKTDEFQDAVDVAIAVALDNGRGRCYLFRAGKYRKSPAEERFKMDFAEEAESESSSSSSKAQLPWLTKEEFIHKYRM